MGSIIRQITETTFWLCLLPLYIVKIFNISAPIIFCFSFLFCQFCSIQLRWAFYWKKGENTIILQQQQLYVHSSLGHVFNSPSIPDSAFFNSCQSGQTINEWLTLETWLFVWLHLWLLCLVGEYLALWALEQWIPPWTPLPDIAGGGWWLGDQKAAEVHE